MATTESLAQIAKTEEPGEGLGALFQGPAAYSVWPAQAGLSCCRTRTHP